VNVGAKYFLLYHHLSEMVDIWLSNRVVNTLYRMGRIGERRQMISHYVLLKRVRTTNLRLVGHGFSKNNVDAPEFALLIQRCRKDTLEYLRAKKAQARK
jgi:hypothetical protein